MSEIRAVPVLSSSPRRLLLGAAIAGPLLFVVGQALLPVLGRDVDTAFERMLLWREQLMVSRLLTTAGAFLLIACVGPVLSLVAGRGRRLLVAGLALLAVGSFFNAVSQVVQGYATWATTAEGVDAGAAMPALLHIDSGLAGVPLSYWSVPVFGLGAVLVAIALLISRRVPVWMPVLLLVGVVAGFATAGTGPIVGVTLAPFAVAIVALIATAARRGYAEDLVLRAETVHAGR